MMRREYVTYEYSTDINRDSASRRRDQTKASLTLLDGGGIGSIYQLNGDKARFTRLRNMLDQLLNDWTD